MSHSISSSCLAVRKPSQIEFTNSGSFWLLLLRAYPQIPTQNASHTSQCCLSRQHLHTSQIKVVMMTMTTPWRPWKTQAEPRTCLWKVTSLQRREQQLPAHARRKCRGQLPAQLQMCLSKQHCLELMPSWQCMTWSTCMTCRCPSRYRYHTSSSLISSCVSEWMTLRNAQLDCF